MLDPISTSRCREKKRKNQTGRKTSTCLTIGDAITNVRQKSKYQRCMLVGKYVCNSTLAHICSNVHRYTLGNIVLNKYSSTVERFLCNFEYNIVEHNDSIVFGNTVEHNGSIFCNYILEHNHNATCYSSKAHIYNINNSNHSLVFLEDMQLVLVVDHSNHRHYPKHLLEIHHHIQHHHIVRRHHKKVRHPFLQTIAHSW